MTLDSVVPSRILLFGKDRMLLYTRTLVLQRAHFVTDVATDMETLKKQLAAPELKCRAVVCCYTATENEREEIFAITTRSQLAMLQLHRIVQPDSLIAQLSTLLGGQS
jgi:hypothetical protein